MCVASGSGRVFTFGYGSDGQLGHGDNEDLSTPKLVEALTEEEVVGASAGSLHTAVWTSGCRTNSHTMGCLGQLAYMGGRGKGQQWGGRSWLCACLEEEGTACMGGLCMGWSTLGWLGLGPKGGAGLGLGMHVVLATMGPCSCVLVWCEGCA